MNIEVNTGGGSASADGGDVVIGDVEASAIDGTSGFAGTVNPNRLATASAMLVGSSDNGTVITEILSSGYVNPTSEAGGLLMDVDASLNDAQILSSLFGVSRISEHPSRYFKSSRSFWPLLCGWGQSVNW